MRGEPGWPEYEADSWGDAVVAAMKLGGVDNLFFVSGSELNFYQEAIAKARARNTPAPRLVTVTHESVALNAALGNAMVRGQPAATAVHVDAGTLHQGAAIHTAWRGDYPVLMTAGGAPRAYHGSVPGSRSSTVQLVQEPRDQGGIVRQYTKMDHRMEHQDNPGFVVSRLLQVAMSLPTGPVYLTIPPETAMLATGGTVRFPTRDQLAVPKPPGADPADMRLVAGWLLQAQNPLICLERSGRDPAAVSELTQLCELLAVPVAESGRADRLNFPTTHWAYSTGPKIADADLVLALDAIAPWVAGMGSPGQECKIVWVSTDPALSRYKTMEYCADLRLTSAATPFLRGVREAAAAMLQPRHKDVISQRRKRLEERQHALAAERSALVEGDVSRGQLTSRVVSHELEKLLPPEAVIMNDTLSSGVPVHLYLRRDRPGTYFRSGSTSGGWGLGAAVGAKLAHPDRDVVHLSGDGYFMFGNPLSALLAASHHKAATLSVVFVNGTYSTGTKSLKQTYPDGYAVAAGNYDGGTFEPVPNFAKLAEAANSYGEEVASVDGVGAALERCLKQTRSGSPAVLAVRLSKEG